MPSWPWVLVGLILVALIFAVIIIRFSGAARRMSREAQAKRNYYVTLDIVASELGHSISALEKRQSVYKRMTKIATVVFVIVLLLTFFLASRPAKITKTSAKMASRDIVLCLDVSGSTLAYDREILQNYQNIISNFTSERIALSIFNSTSRTVFPLTSDYNLVQDKIQNAIDILQPIRQSTNLDNVSSSDAEKINDFLKGTSLKTDSASLIGDGLASCAMQFDDVDANNENRPRYIIFATDNILSGNSIFSLSDAASYAKTKNINLFGIYSGDASQIGAENEVQMKKVIQENSGTYYALQSSASTSAQTNTGSNINSTTGTGQANNNANSASSNSQMVNTIVTDISKAQQKDLGGDEITVISDQPGIPLIILIIIYGGYILIMWRLRQ
jgi:hypothetical protein